MQVQDRIGLSTGLPSSMVPLNKNKDVISPTGTSATSPSRGASASGHNRSSSSNSIPHERMSSSIPLVRSRTAPNQLPQLPKADATPQIEPSHSDSATDNNDWNWPQSTSTSTPASPSRQPPSHDQSDPDSQEQALFEERLCEDIYGVAVRKINQNGKSNLRYVKCLYVDAPEVLHFDEPTSNAPQHYSSNRSVSSRHSKSSRVSLPRLLGGKSHHRTSSSNHASSSDQDAHRSLLREIETNHDASHKSAFNHYRTSTGKVRVLSWGKKKDVTVPLELFTAVKKGKVNERTRRNPCDSSRILSLVTSDIHSTNGKYNSSSSNSVSLDIEAPTRLDRDKFAKAFARFLNVPLIEEDDIIRVAPPSQPYVSTAFPNQQRNHRPPSPHQAGSSNMDGNRSIARSIKSDATPLSWREQSHRQQQSIASSVNNDNSIPDIALTASNSIATNEKGGNRSSSWKQIKAPLPVVTTRGISAPASIKNIAAAKPPLNNRRSISSASGTGAAAPPMHPAIIAASMNNPNTMSSHSKTTIHGNSSRTGSEADDPPLASLPSSTRSRGASMGLHNSNSAIISNLNTMTSSNRKMVLEIPVTTKSKLSKNTNSNHDRSTPATSAISGRTIPNTPATEPTGGANPNLHGHANANNISRDTNETNDMDGSVVSSITGVGFDQDLVEELHLALERMKVELEESRAEASRAVKVAEQAIQSAENSSSKDWNNTVTHKAAEAAATAQKKSAEAMAKARVAEERLELERKAGALRKKQVEKAELQAAHWQTRAAAAEVQRFAVAEALESERKKNQDLVSRAEQAVTGGGGFGNSSKKAFDPYEKIKPSSPARSKIVSAETSAEVDRLRSKLAMESARRRKLLDELQDLRGGIRVYCRLKSPSVTPYKKSAFLEMVSNEVLMLHRNQGLSGSNHGSSSSNKPTTPLCFEFDGILASDMGQQDVYAEFEAICASVVEGFKICVMSYGQANSGKTHTMLGDVVGSRKTIENEGIHLRAAKQLFSLLERRKDRFQDTVTMNLVEVHDEKLIDLLAGTEFGERHGRVETRKSSRRSATTATEDAKSEQPRPKLEIKTNRDGETVVRGGLSVDLATFEDVLSVWTESLAKRSSRLAEQKVEDPLAYEKECHVVATLKVTSKNLSTGSIAYGKMQFVDFASSDITPRRHLGGSGGVSSFLSSSPNAKKLLSSGSPSEQLLDDWKFTNKSLNIVREVVLARSQYQRSVPYRNSTITHILSDSLEADTKVVLIACVSSDEKDLQNTACTLQLAQEMRKVVVGKATRHTTIASSITATATQNKTLSSRQEI